MATASRNEGRAQEPVARESEDLDPTVWLIGYLAQQDGPGANPLQAVFWDVVSFLLSRLFDEATEARRVPVTTAAIRFVRQRLEVAAEHTDRLGEQDYALATLRRFHEHLGTVGDLRRQRDSRLPSSLDLLTEYETVRERLKAALGTQWYSRPRSRLVGEIQSTLGGDYRLPRKDIKRLDAITPAAIAQIALGRRYCVSPPRVRDALKSARATKRKMDKLVSDLSQMTAQRKTECQTPD